MLKSSGFCQLNFGTASRPIRRHLTAHASSLLPDTDARPSKAGGSDLRVRLWRPHDAAKTARIWKQALHDEGLTSHTGRNQSASALQHDVAVALLRQHERKRVATAAARDIRLETALTVGAQASDISGNQELNANRPETSECRLRLQKLRRQRLWAGLVAETKEGHQSGYILLSLQQPLALLPPPLPSTSPFYLHIDGLAVQPNMRRKGTATALLRAAERLARAWRRRSIWLHVDEHNQRAKTLYLANGYAAVGQTGWPWRQQVLMCKNLPLADTQRALPSVRSGEQGVFLWDIK